VDRPLISVVIPTRNRASYLEVALASIAAQQHPPAHEVIVVDDHSTDSTAALAARAGARLVTTPDPGGINPGRNAGVRSARAELVALVDDDVSAWPGWLRALAEGAARHPEALAFGGPIRAHLEGPAPRACGRERPPITALDLGSTDREAETLFGANLTLRRRAFNLAGAFDETIVGGGDEEEWLRRLHAAGGTTVYLADAGLDHRRTGADSRLRALMRGAYARGRQARAWDRRRGGDRGMAGEVRVLAGCGWHTVRRGCPQGLVMGAHSAGRLVETLRPR